MGGRNASRENLERDLLRSHLIAEIGALAAEEVKVNADYAEAIKPHEAKRDAELAAITVKKKAALDQLIASVNESRVADEDITLRLPSGEVSLSTSGSALDFTDISEFMRKARDHKMLNRVSTVKPREPNKTMVKAAIKNFPRFYRAVQHLLVQPRTTTITIKPKNYGGEEVKQELSTTTVPYPAPKTAVEPRTPSS